jgi:hypothetical protein
MAGGDEFVKRGGQLRKSVSLSNFSTRDVRVLPSLLRRFAAKGVRGKILAIAHRSS